MAASAIPNRKSESGTEDKDDLFDCTSKCRSTQHGNSICGIKPSENQYDIMAFWSTLCQNYGGTRDEFGRMAIHVAASHGYFHLLEWLIKHEGVNLNVKDLESGYTPLHRSIFLGQLIIARHLISLGASLNIVDNENLTPMELCLLDRRLNLPVSKTCCLRSDPIELYIWGNNDNYTLGIESQASRACPELLERFGRQQNTPICQVSLNTYHSVFVSQTGEVFSCGVGHGGRLGLGDVSAVLSPRKVRFPKKDLCLRVATGPDHTLFVMDGGVVKSCGSNQKSVLGYPSLDQVLKPKTIDSLKPKYHIFGLRASVSHSVFYSKSSVYTCGVNEGQLGHNIVPFGSHVQIPKLVTCFGTSIDTTSMDHMITHVEVNEFATLIRISKGNLYLLYHNECRRISVKHRYVRSLKVVGGESWVSPGEGKASSGSTSAATPLCVLILMESGRLLIWREPTRSTSSTYVKQDKFGSPASPGLALAQPTMTHSEGTLTRVFFNLGRCLSIRSLDVNKSSIVFVTELGQAFRSSWSPVTPVQTHTNIADRPELKDPSTQTWEQARKKGRDKDVNFFLLPLECMRIKRIPNIHFGEAIFSDPKGSTFSIIQRHPKLDFIEVPIELQSTLIKDLKQLLEDAQQDDDIHDILFYASLISGPVSAQVEKDKMSFPAHRFIIANSCPLLLSQSKTSSSSPEVVIIPNTYGFVFKQVLDYIYTEECEIAKEETVLPNSLSKGGSNSQVDWLKETIVLARKLNLESLCLILSHFETRVSVVSGSGSIEKGQQHQIVRKPCPYHHCCEIIKPTPPLRFKRVDNMDLSDLTLVSNTGDELKVHRCILVARMDYFNSMLSRGSWKESTVSRLNLSCSTPTLNAILEYVYTDEVPSLKKMELVLLGDLLVAADSFLLPVILTHVEVALVELMNYRNVAALLNLTVICNAEQLKRSCLHFISLNIVPLLENRLLDSLDMDIMDELTSYYKRFKQDMFCRTPYIKPKEKEIVSHDAVNSSIQPVLDEFKEFLLNWDDFEFTSKTQNQKHGRVRTRTRTISSCAGGTESPVQEPCPSPTVVTSAVITPPPLKQSENRMIPQTPESKSSASTRTIVPLPTTSLGKLESINTENTYTPILKSSDFPSLGNEGRVLSAKGNVMSPPSECDLKSMTSPNPNLGSRKGKKKTKWVSIDETLDSNNHRSNNPSSASKRFKNESSTQSGRDPNNPWKINTPRTDEAIPSPSTSSSSKLQNQNPSSGNPPVSAFKEILKEEVQKKENLRLALAKPLKSMQIEDQATNELMERYKSEDTVSGTEVVKVERVSTTEFAEPTWLNKGSSSGYAGKS